MNQPVTYVELHSADLDATRKFFGAAFGWQPQPFASPEYLVAPHGSEPGVDTGLLASQDGQPRTVPVIRVDDIDAAIARVTEHGGTLVVPPFTVPGVGKGCYITDPTGLIVGLHAYGDQAA